MEALLLKVNESAAALGITRSRLYQLMQSGELKHVKLGRSTLIPREELESFVARLRESRHVK